MSAALSRRAALAGLLLLGLMIFLMSGLPPQPATILAILPLAALLVTARWPTRIWAVAVASVMLAYFSYGVMEILTDPPGRRRALLFSLLTVGIFLAALDSIRRR